MQHTTEKSTDYKGAALTAWIMIGMTCLLALIPGIGFLTWILAVPILLITFILGIVVLSKNGTGQGVSILIVSLIVAPTFVALAPIVTTGVVMVATADIDEPDPGAGVEQEAATTEVQADSSDEGPGPGQGRDASPAPDPLDAE